MFVLMFVLAVAGLVGLAFSRAPLLNAQPRVTATAAANEIVYVVQTGDTLGAIAARFGTTVNAIMHRNDLASPNLIVVGARLIIPPPGATPYPTYTSAPTQTQRASPIAITALPATDDPSLTLVPTTAGRSLSTAAPTPTPVSPLPFELGGHVVSFSYPRQMSAAGMTWARGIVRWTRGATPDIAQGVIDAAHGGGFKALLTIVGDPAEMGDDFIRYAQDFATFLGGVAALQPDAIEVWTAPNLPDLWAAGAVSPAAYTQMLALAFEAIKRVNPSTLVISAAPDATDVAGCTVGGCEIGAFVRALALAGAGDYADCIGMRYIEGAVAPDETDGDARGDQRRYYLMPTIARFAEAFPNKPLCFVEIGYLAGDGVELAESLAWAARTSVQNQAEWLARALILARQTGRIRLLMVWNIDSTAFTVDDPESAYAIVQDGQCLACITLGVVTGAR